MIRFLAILATVCGMATFANAQTTSEMAWDYLRSRGVDEVGAYFCTEGDRYAYVRPNLDGEYKNSNACFSQLPGNDIRSGVAWIGTGCISAVSCLVKGKSEFTAFARSETRESADDEAFMRTTRWLDIWEKKGANCRVRVRWCPNTENVPVEVKK